MVTLDHVTAVVADANNASDVVERLLGVGPRAQLRMPSMDIRSFRLGSAELHVNAPLGPGVVQDHLRQHGPSLHHMALRVVALAPALRQLEARGFRMLGPPLQTAPGIVEVFIDPKTAAGLWIQLVQREPALGDGTELDQAAIQRLADSSKDGGL